MQNPGIIDALELQRINGLIAQLPESDRNGLRHIDLLMLRPSIDLGRLANEYEPALPRPFRFLTRGLGTRETRSNDMLSLVIVGNSTTRRLDSNPPRLYTPRGYFPGNR